MTRLAWTLWIVTLSLAVLGELLPGTSPPIRWVSSTGISDKVLHYGAYTLLAGIPILAEERDDTYPLVIAGGPGAANPEPLAPFIDLFVLGDGDEIVLDDAGLGADAQQADINGPFLDRA